ncbi:ArsC family reductase [Chitinilyticum litopenaei]|uniref:ArsC family reductase n=1 Tax=Chitinilyticum litopenaei TaxID=1121276 RepID=UPI00040CF1B5|nr:ArsC family reductase [Chitinilyticum litopenaei]
MTTTLYGIANCDTIKKARRWLDAAGIPHAWHDYKKQGISAPLLADWIHRGGWEQLVNRQGTTWRKLDEATRGAVNDADSALAVLLANPSLIKRPVLEHDGTLTVGFSETEYAALFKQATQQTKQLQPASDA